MTWTSELLDTATHRTGPAVGELFETSWQMYASAGPLGSDEPLRHFGPMGFATQDVTAKRVVRVLLEVDDGGDYWAWLDTGAFQPSCIAASEQAMTQRFLLDQTDAPGPREEEKVGLGMILRLKVTILAEVQVRSGRRNWSAAQ